MSDNIFTREKLNIKDIIQDKYPESSALKIFMNL